MLPPPFDILPLSALTKRSLVLGEALFLQGDAVRAIFFLLAGELRLVRHGEGGNTVPVFKAVAGDTFAEAALFSTRYHCDAIAAKDSTVVVLDKVTILSKMACDPEFGKALAQRFASQVQTYRRKLEILAIPGAEDRVFVALADGLLNGKVVDFADEIGLSHEATFRALSNLVRVGRVIRPRRGCYRAKMV